MWNMNDLVEIEYRREDGYRLVFDDGIAGEIDFESYLHRGPVFGLLKDKAFF